jgi:hypothetical protein
MRLVPHRLEVRGLVPLAPAVLGTRVAFTAPYRRRARRGGPSPVLLPGAGQGSRAHFEGAGPHRSTPDAMHPLPRPLLKAAGRPARARPRHAGVLPVPEHHPLL